MSTSEPVLLKRVDVLIKEYELHRNEAVKHIEMYNGQTITIQLFVGALLTVLLTTIQPDGPASHLLKVLQTHPYISFSLLTAGALIGWYFVATVSAVHYTVRILRRRMAVIETEINALLGQDLLTYETTTTPRFLSRAFPVGASLNPITMQVVFRLLILLSLLMALGVISTIIIVDIATRSSFGAMLIVGTVVTAYSAASHAIMLRNLDRGAGSWKQGVGNLGTLTAVFVALWSTLFLQSGGTSWEQLPGMAATWIKNPFIAAFGSAAYSLIAVIPGVPLPTELPMALVPQNNLWLVLTACALGRAIAAALVYMLWSRIDKWLNGRLTAFSLSPHPVVGYVTKHGFWAYFITQAVPLAPLRTGLWFYAMYSKSLRLVVGGAVVGALLRNTIVFVLVSRGLIPLQKLFT